MTFEEQLTRAFETLTERLRGDIDLQVQRTSAELVTAAPYDRDRAASDVQSTAEEMEIVVAAARQQAHEEGLAAGREAGRRDALEERARQTVDVASRERLGDAVRSIERARSLTEILDTLVSCARTEAARADVWLIRGGRLHQWRSPGSDGAGADHVPARSLDEGSVIAEAARTNAAAAADGTLAVPIAIAGQVVAILHAELASQKSEVGSHHVELLTRYAARCLEALTAFKTARALTQRPGESDAADGSQPAIDAASAEEDTSARRYARLLVSEIKLYHESAVVDGRRDRDLATRLGGEIARARVMYEQRVPPHVRQRADYFHDELVRTLANGDARLLEVRDEK
jgi:hypothetical protein